MWKNSNNNNCVTYIHRTVCKYVKKHLKLYIKRIMDTAFGYISIDILDIHVTIWICILQFGYIYIYILQFGYVCCNLGINMETQHKLHLLHFVWGIFRPESQTQTNVKECNCRKKDQCPCTENASHKIYMEFPRGKGETKATKLQRRGNVQQYHFISPRLK